jgi:hypothetical protein
VLRLAYLESKIEKEKNNNCIVANKKIVAFSYFLSFVPDRLPLPMQV